MLCQESACYLVEVGHWVNGVHDKFSRNRLMPYRLVSAFVREKHNKGIFVTAYRYNQDKADTAQMIGDLYFDFDSVDDFELVRKDAVRALSFLDVVYKIKAQDVYIYFSGKKGVHLIVPYAILGVTPTADLNKIYKSIAKDVHNFVPNKTLDLRVYDNKRMFRVPGSIHETSGLYKISLTYEELKGLPYEAVLKKAQTRHVEQKPLRGMSQDAQHRYKDAVKKAKEEEEKLSKMTHAGDLRTTPPCVQHLLDEGASEGHRNDSTAVLTSFLKSTGKSFEETMEIVKCWNDEKNMPATPFPELRATVTSIYAGMKKYGCSTLKELSVCSADRCELMKKKGKSNGRVR